MSRIRTRTLPWEVLDYSLGFPMATLYVENVPDDIYKALRKRAKANRKSIAAEVIELLEQNIPTEAELKRRRKMFDDLAELRSRPPIGPGPFPSAEEMIREDRER
jgi:plasmid stability protein